MSQILTRTEIDAIKNQIKQMQASDQNNPAWPLVRQLLDSHEQLRKELIAHKFAAMETTVQDFTAINSDFLRGK